MSSFSIRQLLRSDRPLAFLLGLGAGLRVLAFLAVIFVPVHNEIGGRVSPLEPQTSVDINFYIASTEVYFGRETGVFTELRKAYLADTVSPGFAPPVLPTLLFITGYINGHTLPLALVYLALGIGLVVAWLIWLRRSGLHVGWLLLFAALPNAIWFTLNISTDLLFAVFVSGFYLAYFHGAKTRLHVWLWMLFLLASLLTRTNGLSLLLFVVVDLLFISPNRFDNRFRLFLGTAACGAIAALFYLPSLLGFTAAPGRFLFFGHTVAEYVDGIYGSLPNWMDIALSWLSLVGAKLLYLVGLRPSFGDIPIHMLALRSLQGLILLPGLLYLFARADIRTRVFVLIFILPVIVGPAQDRYVLPIQALLFLYGALAYIEFWRRLRLRFRPSG